MSPFFFRHKQPKHRIPSKSGRPSRLEGPHSRDVFHRGHRRHRPRFPPFPPSCACFCLSQPSAISSCASCVGTPVRRPCASTNTSNARSLVAGSRRWLRALRCQCHCGAHPGFAENVACGSRSTPLSSAQAPEKRPCLHNGRWDCVANNGRALPPWWTHFPCRQCHASGVQFAQLRT